MFISGLKIVSTKLKLYYTFKKILPKNLNNLDLLQQCVLETGYHAILYLT